MQTFLITSRKNCRNNYLCQQKVQRKPFLTSGQNTVTNISCVGREHNANISLCQWKIVPRIIDVGRKYSVNNSLCWQKEYLQWKQNSVQLFFDVGRNIVYTILNITKYSTSNSLCLKITKCKQLILTECKVETISIGLSSGKIAAIVFILKIEFRERADDIFGWSRP